MSYNYDNDRKERTLDVSDLASFPRGRAIMFASGAPVALLETVPWMGGKHDAQIRASIAAHDPSATSGGYRFRRNGESVGDRRSIQQERHR